MSSRSGKRGPGRGRPPGRPKGSRLTDSTKKEKAASSKRKFKAEKTRYNNKEESYVSETSDSGPEHQPLMGPPKTVPMMTMSTSAKTPRLEDIPGTSQFQLKSGLSVTLGQRVTSSILGGSATSADPHSDSDAAQMSGVEAAAADTTGNQSKAWDSLLPPTEKAGPSSALNISQSSGKWLHRKWLRRTKHWDACPVKSKKDYSFISTLIQKALVHRFEEPQLMQQKVVLEEGDPRRLSKFLSPEAPEPTKDIYAQKQTRL